MQPASSAGNEQGTIVLGFTSDQLVKKVAGVCLCCKAKSKLS